MPSGKKSRQQRSQVPAPPTTGSGAGARKASPRTLAIIGGVIIVVIVAVVLGIVLSQGTSKYGDGSGDGPTLIIAKGTPATGSSTNAAVPFAADNAKLLKGIPQNGLVLGDPKAPVTLIEYIDTQCPVCREFETNQLPGLLTKFVRPGDLKIEMKPWNIIDANYPGNDDSLRGQKAVIGAAVQNKAFNYSQLLYDNQGTEGTGWFNDAMFSNIAASIDGMNTSQLADDGNSSATQNQINAIDAYASNQLSKQVVAAGQQPGTPTLLLQKGNGTPTFFGVGYPDQAKLDAAITALLN